MKHPLLPELQVASRLAVDAGRAILEVYATDFSVVEKADDAGPVTEADRRSNALIVAGLRAAFPSDGIVAEESEFDPATARSTRCWFIDPLDGTKDFVARNGEFAVQIGLAIAGKAVLGVVHVPAADRLYTGLVGGGCQVTAGGRTRDVSFAELPLSYPPRIVVSRSRPVPAVADWAARLGTTDVRPCGSVGVKCGRIIDGEADLYVMPAGGSSRWDACAPEAIMRAAGGFFSAADGRPYRYDDGELVNARGLMAATPAARRLVRERLGL